MTELKGLDNQRYSAANCNITITVPFDIAFMTTIKNINVDFGLRVKMLRLEAGLSQEALADSCGLDRTYISGIERGIRNPTLKIVAVIAQELRVELDALFRFK